MGPGSIWYAAMTTKRDLPHDAPQDQGVLDEPVRDLDEEDEDAALDDLEKAALALGVDSRSLIEPDGGPTEIA